MANTTRLTIQTNILRNLAKTNVTAKAIVNNCITIANKSIARRHNFEECMTKKADCTCVIDTYEYDLSSATNWILTDLFYKTIYSITYLDGTESRKLRYMPYNRFEKEYPLPSTYSSDRPDIYTKNGDIITLFRPPIAAKECSIRFAKWPVVMTADTDTNTYRPDKDELVEALATAFAWAVFEEDEAAALWFNIAAMIWKEMGMDLNNKPDASWNAEGFHPAEDRGASGSYWNDPFIQRQP